MKKLYLAPRMQITQKANIINESVSLIQIFRSIMIICPILWKNSKY